jgi:hypothetical protein
MNAPTPTHEAINLAGARWTDPQGRSRGFAAARPGFGVRVIATGEYLAARDGHPATWSTKKTAAIVAQYPHTTATIRVALP